MPAVSSCVLVVTYVSVSPSSMGVLGEDFLSGSDSEFVESQFFSLSLESVKLFLLRLESQGGMSMEDARENRRQFPKQAFRHQDLTLTEGGRRFTKRSRKRFQSCESLEVDVNELEHFVLAPDEPDADVKYNALHAKGERKRRFFHTSSQKGNNGMSTEECSSYTSRSAANSALRLSK